MHLLRLDHSLQLVSRQFTNKPWQTYMSTGRVGLAIALGAWPRELPFPIAMRLLLFTKADPVPLLEYFLFLWLIKGEAGSFLIEPRLPGDILDPERGVNARFASPVRAAEDILFISFGGSLSRFIAIRMGVDND